MPTRNPQTAKEAWKPGRLLAIDLGTQRIGFALSNTGHTLATSLPPLPRKKWGQLKPEFQTLIQNHGITGIIMGYPLNMDGTEGPMAQSIKDFASQIEKDLTLTVLLWDERLTSHAAEQAFFEQRQTSSRQTRASKKESVGHIDSPAATLLLQSALPTLS